MYSSIQSMANFDRSSVRSAPAIPQILSSTPTAMQAVVSSGVPLKVPPAVFSQRRPHARLLVVDRSKHRYEHASLAGLGTYLRAGDLLVVNDAATLPASLWTRIERTGEKLEVRLLRCLDPDLTNPRLWQVVTFGAGSWRQKTEDRGQAPTLSVGDRLIFSSLSGAVVVAVSDLHTRLVTLQLDSSEVPLRGALHTLYQNGVPIQYSYHREALELWDHQTIFAAHPVALEPPSAAMHFTWKQVLELRSRGIGVVALTHATGISSTGDQAIDGLLPLPERYTIPSTTAAAIEATRQKGGRVIAVGTGVVRALESAGNEDGRVAAGSESTRLRLGPTWRRRVVDGMVTGMHEAGSSHLELLQVFAPLSLISSAYGDALSRGYLWHEYGDVSLMV